jgi:hypothetical protein
MPAPKGHPAYNKKGEGGRPREWTDELIEEMADRFETFMGRPDSIWYEDFCLEQGINPVLLGKWAKVNERFGEVYEKSKSWQKSKLVKGGLLNNYNASFTKFVMANTCGWSERQETKLSGDILNPLQFIFDKVDGGSKELIDEEV